MSRLPDTDIIRHEHVDDDFVESGEYYSEARKWYMDKYILPACERNYLILLLVLISCAAVYTYTVLDSIMPITKKIPILVTISDMSQQYAQIKKLSYSDDISVKSDDPDRHIVAYLMEKYIIAKESYDYENNFKQLEKNRSYIQQFSSPEIFRHYEGTISTRNLDSPVLKYRKHTTRTAEPLPESFNIDKRFDEYFATRESAVGSIDQAREYTASMNFIATEQNVRGKMPTKWRAEIDFLYSGVTFNHDEGEFYPLQFTVLDYRIAQLQE